MIHQQIKQRKANSAGQCIKGSRTQLDYKPLLFRDIWISQIRDIRADLGRFTNVYFQFFGDFVAFERTLRLII